MSIYRPGFSHPDDLRSLYWGAVMDAIRAYKDGSRYRSVIEQDLRPLLAAVGREDWCGQFRGPILGLASFGTVDMSHAEKAYVTRLCEFVQSRLRFTENGEPAAWVVHAVHADVCGLDGDFAWLRAKSPFRDGESGNQAAAARIQIEVVDDGEFSIDARIATPAEPPMWSTGSHRFDQGRHWQCQLPIGAKTARLYGPATGLRLNEADWDRVREVAIAAVDSAIDALRKIHEAQTANYQRRNSNFKLGVVETYAPALVHWLWGRNQSIPRGPFRNQIYELVHEIGIDTPITNSRRIRQKNRDRGNQSTA